jgi:PqqD family protein of HPr-rel-A system
MADALVVFDPETNVVHRLNATAQLIWESCDGERSVTDIAAGLTARYDVAPDAAERDVARVLAELEALELITRG